MGETEFGLLNGVVKTRQAWAGETEVVEVIYDPKVVTRKELDAFATKNEFWVQNELPLKTSARAMELRMDKEQKYYLLQSPLKNLPMSEAQACRVNASLEGDWKQYLSPSQIKLATKLMKPKSKK